MVKGKIALVTGASRGIGAAIAQRLGADGARVIGTATTADGAARIGAQLAAHGGRGAVLDVASQESIDALMADIEAREGAIGILCNNAGITRDTLLLRMKQDDWDAVLQTNLASVFRLSKAVLRGMMKAREGRIISITSVVALTGNPGQGNYAAAKAGIIGFTKSLAREVGSRGITVNCVAPGFIDTDMTRSLNDAQRETINGQIPLGRLGQPADIAAAVAFLSSDGGAYITGETLHVNGGMYMA
ncbi:MAG: 3-oxoacyl-[acyl-carrier protein] reductase [Gammaproteobacteria bacterium]|jgi:3-oxoacyl-[acyl-carrier protein] reductase|nr:3-oxoacyl-[acyl-carrier protein] reductase [Gammaproteobacteria bacterium]